MTHKTLLCFGYGASAAALAKILLPLGWRVIGTTRDADKIKTCDAELHLWHETDLAPFDSRGQPYFILYRAERSGRFGLGKLHKGFDGKTI